MFMHDSALMKEAKCLPLTILMLNLHAFVESYKLFCYFNHSILPHKAKI